MRGPNLLLLLGGVAALLFFMGKRRAPTGFSFAGSVIGECPYNGEAGLLIEYEDGTTECVPSVDL
jgi:hypothetical protein